MVWDGIHRNKMFMGFTIFHHYLPMDDMLMLKPRPRAAAASSLTTTTASSRASCNIRCFGNWGASGAWGAWVVVLCLSRGNQFQHVSTRGDFVGLESRGSNQLSFPKCLSWISNCSLKILMFWIFMDFLSCCFGSRSTWPPLMMPASPWGLGLHHGRGLCVQLPGGARCTQHGHGVTEWRSDAWRDAEKGKQLHSLAWRDQRKSLEFYGRSDMW